MAPFDHLTLARLTTDDVERGFALSTEIGWNQNAADWSYMLENGSGWGRTDGNGKLVGSAMALPYGEFGWVCMVLVSPDQRRMGIATDLMNRVIEDLEADGIVPGLDATPAGREVYRQLGFVDIYGLERLWAETVKPSPPTEETPARVEPMTAEMVEEVAAYDAKTFGGDRGALLAQLRDRQPDRAFVARAGEWLAGFVLAREGRQATQIGPVVAEDAAVAMALVSAALDNLEGPAVVDVMDYQTPYLDWLKSCGFEYQRPYIRMLKGRDSPIDEKDYVYSPAGPELG